MQGSNTSTFPTTITDDAYAKRFRAQATGIGQTRSASEATGARRAQVAIDCAPPAQLKVADRSYPKVAPVFDPATGCYYDKASGQKCDYEGNLMPGRYMRAQGVVVGSLRG